MRVRLRARADAHVLLPALGVAGVYSKTPGCSPNRGHAFQTLMLCVQLTELPHRDCEPGPREDIF